MGEAKVPCYRSIRNTNERYCCDAHLCPNCTELLALRRRVDELEGAVLRFLTALSAVEKHPRPLRRDMCQEYDLARAGLTAAIRAAAAEVKEDSA